MTDEIYRHFGRHPHRADIDLRLQVNWQANAILAALPDAFESYMVDEDRTKAVVDLPVVIRLWPLFNHREAGYVLEVRPHDQSLFGDVLLLSFGECRRSDNVFVQHRTINHGLFSRGGVSVDDALDEDAYRNRFTAYLGTDMDAVMLHIVERIGDFAEAHASTEAEDAA